ncbi:hypothetical protein VP01_1707g4 [Puccinia sorghi]|uniref:DNA repair metallo-beta-lactamase domain-containing protein n=1 Tax=Puccinia sorghi TaxID=27349 RepID=A0A0L6VHF9_9BASI|nr:hypothetical protein VP01_1707g4 [Puccinia sorghi]
MGRARGRTLGVRPNPQDIKQEKEDDQEGSVKSLLSEPKKPPKYTSKPRLVKTNKKGRSGTEKGEAKKVPFYKLMPGTTLSVDCFSHGAVPGVTGYFLSHAHSDHYTKLSSTWAHGKIYCSKTTANLVILKLRVHPRWLVPLDFNRPYTIEGVRVVLIDANHCPGSAMFLFEGLTKPEGKPFRYLHCGDFRAMPSHLRHPEIHEKVIDICYLDTTYLDPKYCFPAQHQVIDGCCKAMKRRVLEADRSATMSAKDQKKFAEMGRSRDVFKSWLTPSSPAVSLSPAAPSTDQPKAASSKNLDFTRPVSGPAEVPTPNQPKLASIFAPKTAGTRSEPSAKTTLIVVGTYSIGKERIVIELASTLSTKVFCADARKVAILRCVDEADEEAVLQGMLTPNPLAAQIHLVNLFALNKSGFLESYLAKYRAHFSHVIGIKPTGWCYKPASSTIACSPLSQDLAAFIAAFQQQQQESHSNAVGQLIFPEKVKPSIADFVEIYGVPYSEHSVLPPSLSVSPNAFFILLTFVLVFRAVLFLPIVPLGAHRPDGERRQPEFAVSIRAPLFLSIWRKCNAGLTGGSRSGFGCSRTPALRRRRQHQTALSLGRSTPLLRLLHHLPLLLLRPLLPRCSSPLDPTFFGDFLSLLVARSLPAHVWLRPTSPPPYLLAPLTPPPLRLI